MENLSLEQLENINGGLDDGMVETYYSATGGVIGATIGSIGGPIGAGVGTVVGSVVGYKVSKMIGY